MIQTAPCGLLMLPLQCGSILLSHTKSSVRSVPSDVLQHRPDTCDHKALLFLHRNYFAIALTDERNDPLEHQFRGSILAVYNGAIRLSRALRDLSHIHPCFISKFWYLWSAMFSACVSHHITMTSNVYVLMYRQGHSWFYSHSPPSVRPCTQRS